MSDAIKIGRVTISTIIIIANKDENVLVRVVKDIYIC
jgi:hypothetical protein